MKKGSFSHKISTENKSVMSLNATLFRVSRARKGGGRLLGGGLNRKNKVITLLNVLAKQTITLISHS